MDIHGITVLSPSFGDGIITEQSESAVTVDFHGNCKRFLYPSSFEKHLCAQDPAIQKEITSELAAEAAENARREHIERRRALILAEQQKQQDKAKAKPAAKKKKPV